MGSIEEKLLYHATDSCTARHPRTRQPAALRHLPRFETVLLFMVRCGAQQGLGFPLTKYLKPSSEDVLLVQTLAAKPL